MGTALRLCVYFKFCSGFKDINNECYWMKIQIKLGSFLRLITDIIECVCSVCRSATKD